MFTALKSRGADIQYNEFHAALHGAWTAAYAQADVWTWMLQQEKR